MESNNSSKPIELFGETEYEAQPIEEKAIESDILQRRIARGRVRWFERSLGYGFIQEDGNTAEIFVHQSAIQVPGVKKLRKGQRVAFEWCQTKKGIIALNVIPICEKPEALEKQRRERENADPERESENSERESGKKQA